MFVDEIGTSFLDSVSTNCRGIICSKNMQSMHKAVRTGLNYILDGQLTTSNSLADDQHSLFFSNNSGFPFFVLLIPGAIQPKKLEDVFSLIEKTINQTEMPSIEEIAEKILFIDQQSNSSSKVINSFKKVFPKITIEFLKV
ncbi:MAG: hypothetical protein HOE90_08990 [Bacteriovoracaceae bacterium]|jgi:hypothetical protein|nr:hypothetical protein [Bacteriovoracaceae bacterium]